VNPITSGSSCGACNHSCGNGEMGCSQGQCSPVSVITDGPSILGFGVDQGSIFVHVEYDSGTGGIDQCAVGACIIQHIVSGPNDPNTFNGPITATGSYIAIQSNLGNEPFEYCPESNCTFTVISSSDLNTWVAYGNTFISSLYGSRADFFSVFQLTDAGITHLFNQGNAGGMGSQADTPMALDDTHYVFSYYAADAGQHVVAAGPLDGGGQDSNLTVLTSNVPNFLNVLNGVVYLTTTSTTTSSSSVTTCPVTGCTAPANLVSNTYPTTIVETAIDPSGFYWLNSQGAIWKCKAGGCNGTGVAVTQPGQGDPQATQFVLNGGFVYFLSTDAKTIWRIAEPL
jgi:hypothetical protein